jgi:hypothetical protein
MNCSFRPFLLFVLSFALVGVGSLRGAPDQAPKRTAPKPPARIDLNSATERDLLSLPDITFPLVRMIMANRPYRDTRELVSKGIISEATYGRIRGMITVKPPPAPKHFVIAKPLPV